MLGGGNGKGCICDEASAGVDTRGNEMTKEGREVMGTAMNGNAEAI